MDNRNDLARPDGQVLLVDAGDVASDLPEMLRPRRIVGVRDLPGQGCLFTVDLPRAIESGQARP